MSLQTLASTPILPIDSEIFKDLSVVLTATLGETTMSVGNLLALKEGAVVKLDLKTNGLVELWLKDKVIGRGEIVAVDDNFAVRLVEIAPLS
jgi:flagellar motor switch protein FliN/FliY